MGLGTVNDYPYEEAHPHHLEINCTHFFCYNCGKGVYRPECAGCEMLAFDGTSGDKPDYSGLGLEPGEIKGEYMTSWFDGGGPLLLAEGPQAMHKDAGKPPIGLINRRAMEEEAKVMAYGAEKYASHRWREGMSWQRILDSIGRHWIAYNAGETLDPESGISHMAHIRADAGFLLEYEETHKENDDRYDILLGKVRNVPKS